MRKVVKYLDNTLAVLAIVFSLAFVIVVSVQIFSRTFLPRTPAWTEEISRYCFIYAIASAGGLAVRKDAFVAVDLLTNFIPKRFQKLHKILLNLFLMIFVIFFEVCSVFKFAFLKQRLVSTALEIPMQYIYFAMVFLFAMLALSYLIELILLLTGQKELEEEGQAQ